MLMTEFTFTVKNLSTYKLPTHFFNSKKKKKSKTKKKVSRLQWSPHVAAPD